LEKGEAEATSGFLSFKPRYVVERSVMGSPFFRPGVPGSRDRIRYLILASSARENHWTKLRIVKKLPI
jgi:hypothetical protein